MTIKIETVAIDLLEMTFLR